MHLIHNQVYKLTTDANGLAAGIYRIIADDIRTDTTYCVQIKSESTHARPKGGRPRIGALKQTKRYTSTHLVGSLYKVLRKDLLELIASHELILLSLDLPGIYYKN